MFYSQRILYKSWNVDVCELFRDCLVLVASKLMNDKALSTNYTTHSYYNAFSLLTSQNSHQYTSRWSSSHWPGLVEVLASQIWLWKHRLRRQSRRHCMGLFWSWQQTLGLGLGGGDALQSVCLMVLAPTESRKYESVPNETKINHSYFVIIL